MYEFNKKNSILTLAAPTQSDNASTQTKPKSKVSAIYVPEDKKTASKGKKPLVIAGVIILIIILMGIFALTILPQINFNQPSGNDTNLQGNSAQFSCKPRINLNIGGTFAVLANRADKSSIVSAKGTSAAYIQIYQNKDVFEAIKNTFADSNNAEKEIVNLLKQKGVTSVALSTPSQALVSEFEKANIQCYNVSGQIISLLGEKKESVPDTSYCQELKADFNTINGNVAIASNRDNESSIISGKNSTSPYFLLYTNSKFTEAIENTYADSNNSETEVVSLLKGKGINTVIVGVSGEKFEIEIEKAKIKCYRKTGLISEIVN